MRTTTRNALRAAGDDGQAAGPKTTPASHDDAPPSDLDLAVREAAEAAELLAALEERHHDGDQAVTVDQLTEHNELASLARQRRDTAERAAGTAHVELQARRQAEAVAQAAELLAAHSLDRLAELYRDAVAAQGALVDFANGRNATIHTVHSLLVGAGYPRASSRDPQAHGEATAGGEAPTWVRLGGVQHETHPAGDWALRGLLDVAVARDGLPGQSNYSTVTRLVRERGPVHYHPDVARIAGPLP